jgi:hypothetical protein
MSFSANSMATELINKSSACGFTLQRLQEYNFSASPASRALARSFTPPPDLDIWAWADENVMLHNEDAAEPGEYRSAKTPWTRRLQELIRRPFMLMWNFTSQQWQRVPVHEVSVQKSSQSGYSEGALNGIRWRASFRPCNVIYAIDSAGEAEKIAKRLLRSLQLLDPAIFTGNPNDIKSLFFKLRGMDLYFYGSGAEGKFANKQAPLRVNDEVEEHQFTTTADNLDSRGKTSEHGGFQINLSKPKFKGGPISKLFLAGNQEEFFVPCPHCRLMQPLTFFPKEMDVPFSEEIDEIRDEQTGAVIARMPRPLPLGEKRKMKTGRIVFDHCRNLLGKWDQLRILQEAYYECANPACVADPNVKGRIYEGSSKRWMIDRGAWMPMVLDGTPGVVSQHFSDLYSEDSSVTWGRLVIRWLALKKKGTEGMRTFYNHYLGEVWSEQGSVTTSEVILSNIAGRTLFFVDSTGSDGNPVRSIFNDEPSAARLADQNAARGMPTPVIRSVCPPYKRGTIPFELYKQHPRSPGTILLGSDVGGVYAKWAAIAVAANLMDCALIDWGTALDPEEILRLMLTRTWKNLDGTPVRILRGFIDARHRTKEVYQSCLASRGVLIPVMGVGGAAAQSIKLWSYHSVPTYSDRMKQLDFNKQRSLDSTYIERFQKKRKRMWVPTDVEEDPELVEELCGEEQEENKKGQMVWKDPAPRPNHYGDCVAEAVTGLDFLTRDLRPAVEPSEPSPN